jgi:parvulin-like peptidyl-prolyl isomerase
MRFLSLFIILTAAFISCTPRPKAPVLDNAVVVGKAGDKVITDKDLLDRIDVIEETFPLVYSTHIQKKKLLVEMMNIELLYQEALKRNLDKKYEFKSRLANLYIDLISKEARSKITNETLIAYYKKNRLRYDQISARHILLKAPLRASQSEKDKIYEKMKSLRKEILQSPDKFPEYAKKHSQDGAAANGGSLGYFTYGMMVPPFSKAAFALKDIGDISPIVTTRFGYHIIQLVGEKRKFENYKEIVRNHLARESQKSRLDEELKRLKKKKAFSVYEENLAKLSPLPKEINTDPDILIPKEQDESSDKKTN